MKKRVYNLSTFLLLLIFSLPILASAQSNRGSIDEDFNWNASDESKTLYVKVKPGADKLTMNFDGRISEGAFFMTAYDPEGNKVGGFSLVCSGENDVNINIDVAENGSTRTEVHTDGHSHTHVNTNTNNNSNIRSTTTTTTTTTRTTDGEEKTKVKSKSKQKSKQKGTRESIHTDSDGKGSKGVMKKTISDPIAGNWKFVLEAKAVTGTLSAKIDQD